MPRSNIGRLKLPPLKYRLDRVLPGPGSSGAFEIKTAVFSEDERRARSLTSATLANLTERRQAVCLAIRIDPHGVGTGERGSLASATDMRVVRIKTTGAILQIIDEHSGVPVAAVTLVPTGHRFNTPSLDNIDPRKLLASIRTDLNRCRAAAADGWLVLVLHGEFDTSAALYRLHFHGIAAGGMIDVVNGLKKLRKYRSKRITSQVEHTAVDKPVMISRKPITNLPTTVSYIFQSFWPARWIGTTADGQVRKQRQKHRIPEPQHSEVLLWLDKWNLKDITVLIKMRVSKGRLVLSS